MLDGPYSIAMKRKILFPPRDLFTVVCPSFTVIHKYVNALLKSHWLREN
jgi:hypothetical protein